MKYLVNRETKEHIRYHEDCSVPLPGWDIVEADDEGWIKWEGGKRPLPKDCMVEVKYAADQRRSQMEAGAYDWQRESRRLFNIEAYRPILPAESKPEFKASSEWQPVPSDDDLPRAVTAYMGGGNGVPPPMPCRDIFAELRSSVDIAARIPTLIAEINAMLPEGYSVTQTAQVMAEPETHASWDEPTEADGFRVGDFVECISDRDSAYLLKVGTIYRVRKIRNGELVFDGNDCSWMTSRFNLHSRPVTK